MDKQNINGNGISNIINTNISLTKLQGYSIRNSNNSVSDNIVKQINNALVKKTFVYDNKNDKIIAITDAGAIEINDAIISQMMQSLSVELIRLKEIANTGMLPNLDREVEAYLLDIENIHAAYINTPEFAVLKKNFCQILLDIKNKSKDGEKQVNIGIREFLDKSEKVLERESVNVGNRIIKYGEDKRALRIEFISELLKYGVVNYEFLVEQGVISNCNLFCIDEFFRKPKLLSNSQLQHAFFISGIFDSREEILDYYLSNDKRTYLDLATTSEIAKAILDNKIEAKICLKKLGLESVSHLNPDLLENLLCFDNFPKGTKFISYSSSNDKSAKKYLTTDFLDKLDRQTFMRIVLSNKIKYLNPLKSNDYIERYGKIYSDDIIDLSEHGLVDPQDVIKIVNFSFIKNQNEEEYKKMIENIKKFYTAKRLEELLKGDKINGKFSELFNKFLDKYLTEDERLEYFQNLINEMKAEENQDEIIPLLITKGIDIPSGIDYKFDKDKLFDMYVNNVISEKDIFDFYKKGFIGRDVLKETFSEDDIIQHFKNGKLDNEIILLLSNRKQILKDKVQNENLNIEDIIALYTDKDGLSIDELDEITEQMDLSDKNIVDLLPDSISSDQIRDLFMHYYISHDDLSYLTQRGIITQKQSEEFAKSLATQEQYDSIFNENNRFIILTRKTEGIVSGNGNFVPTFINFKNRNKFKNDPELQQAILTELGFDDRVLYLEGTNNSLTGYKVYPSKELEVMLFFNSDKPQNATYIMSLQQGLYLLNKVKRKNNSTKQVKTVVESDTTKRDLRETEHVKVKNACRGWGKNIVDAIKALSPKLRQKLNDNQEYKQKIDKIIQEIRDDYDLRKEE